MSSTSSISGLASGLDTASIISQLMALEKQPQTRLKTQQTTEKSVVTALQGINATTASLATAAASLAKASTWQTVTGASSNKGFVVTTSDGAAAGASLSVKVLSLATTSQTAFTTASGLADMVTGQSLTLTGSDGTEHSIPTGGGTLKEVIAGINAATADTGVTATAVKVGDGSYKLLVQSTTTGAGTAFTLTNADGTDLLGGATVRAGTDASIDLGLGLVATSSTNTFREISPGVDLTLSPTLAVGDSTTITLAQDSTAITASVKSLVDSINSLLTTIDTQSKNATSTSSSSSSKGPLAGDPVSRSLRYELLNSVFGGTGTMATVGIQTTRDGMLVFDEDTFTAAYAANPEGVAAQFTSGATTAADGFAARVASVAKAASNSIDGSITKSIQSHTTMVDSLQDRIDEWDTRLSLKQSALEAQYTALETALSTINSQGTWLTSQIASLPTWSSSSD